MAQSLTTTDLKKLLGYPFSDPHWKNKFLIGSLVVLAGFVIPLIPFAAIYGYMMKIMRRIIVEQSEPFLPEWEDWGQLLADGFKLLGAIFIYTLPIVLVFLIGYGFFIGSIAGATVLAGAAEQGGEAENLLPGLMTLGGGLVFMVTFFIGMLLAFGWGIVLPAVMGHVVATGDFGAAFRWREWWPIFRANLSGFVIAYVVVLALSYGLSFILYFAIILCCLLPFIIAPITMYLMLIQGALFAQAYRDGVQKLKNKVELV